MKNILIIIPARMGSSRFPGKPLAKIDGIPMVGRVYQNVIQSSVATDVVVATCDKEILDYIESIGGNAVMTSKSHERASDRCAEALKIFEEKKQLIFDIVVMVQGDEPMTNADMIDEAVMPMLNNESINVVNLMGEIGTLEEFNDRNCIKVVVALNGDAIYFSREPIPSLSKTDSVHMRKQVCVIPFTRDYLIKYTSLKPTPLEIAESIDMLRIIEHGDAVRMIPTNHQSFSVDTLEDLKRVENILKNRSISK